MGGGSDIYVFEMLMVLSIQFKLVLPCSYWRTFVYNDCFRVAVGEAFICKIRHLPPGRDSLSLFHIWMFLCGE